MGAEHLITVVVPTRNRPVQLSSCLAALAAQEYPGEKYEIVVVDDAGSVPLDSIVSSVTNRMRTLLVRHDRRAGPAKARNTGIAHASGSIVAFTDDDCTPEPTWLSALIDRVILNPPTIVGGRTINALPDDRYAAASQLILDMVYEYHNASPRGPRFFASNNICAPIGALREIGGFDTSFPSAAAEDREFCDMCLHRRYRLCYAPDAVVRHAHGMSLGGFWVQHFNYGRGAARFHLKRRSRNTPGLSRDIRFHAQLPRMLCARLSEANLPQVLGTWTLMATWQLANLAGYVAQTLARHL